MSSLTAKPPNIFSISTPFPSLHQSRKPFSISAHFFPPSPPSRISKDQPPPPANQNVYQPFRPPPSPLPPKFRNLDTDSRIEILSNRLAAWFEYAPLIPSLIQEGFTSDSLEEITGITGIEQNRLVVASKVRDTLVESNVDPDVLAFFDSQGDGLLCEIKFLGNQQRAAAVKYIVEKEFDVKKTGELAKAMKDYPKRRGDKGWETFDVTLPGDCLAFMYFRQAQEHQMVTSEEMRKASLGRALEVVESEGGRIRIMEELDGKKEVEKVGGVVDDEVRVPVVRLKIGEVAEANVVVLLPVCSAEEMELEVEAAPWECGGQGEFGVVNAEKEWRRWIALPGWEPISGLRKGGVVVAYKNAGILPWRVNSWNKEEPVLVVVDRGNKEVVADDGFYLIVGGGNGNGVEGLKVERGLALKEIGVSWSLGAVVLVVRPPREEDDELTSED